MPFVPTPNGIKVEMRYTQDGQRVENTFWFIAAGAEPNPTEMANAVAICWDWWDQHLKLLQSSAVVLREIYASDQSSADGPVITYTIGLPANATNVNTPEPNNVTLCVSLRTAKRGRSYRGRSYIIGATTNTVIASRFTGAAVAAWQAAYDVLVSSAASEGLQLAVASFRNAGVNRTAGVLTPVIDAVIVDDVVDSQRKRLPGRGM